LFVCVREGSLLDFSAATDKSKPAFTRITEIVSFSPVPYKVIAHQPLWRIDMKAVQKLQNDSHPPPTSGRQPEIMSLLMIVSLARESLGAFLLKIVQPPGNGNTSGSQALVELAVIP
jgi:hypothetical protein